MRGRKRVTEDKDYIFTNSNRSRIIQFCEVQPRSILEIEKRFNFSRGTARHHLNILKKMGLLRIKKDKGKRGSPSKYIADAQKVRELKKNEYLSVNEAIEASLNGFKHDFEVVLPEDKRQKVLSVFDKEKGLTHKEYVLNAMKIMPQNDTKIWLYPEYLESAGMIETRMFLTEKGKKALKS